MGNLLSTSYDVSADLYDKYYPKCKWLSPRYVAPTLYLSHLGLQLAYASDCAVVPRSSYRSILLVSAAGSLGLHLWVSVFQYLTLIKVLPRHQFSEVQSALFPKYFFVSTFFAFESLSAYLAIRAFRQWKDESLILGGLFVASFFFSAVNLTCFNPATIKYNTRMHEIEKNNGEGAHVVGKLPEGSKSLSDPEYRKARCKFLEFHGLSFTANLITLATSVAQVYLLANRLSF